MRGLKNAQNVNIKMYKALKKFVDKDDIETDDRVEPKIKEKKKPKAKRLKERAEKRKKLMREVLQEETRVIENNNSKSIQGQLYEVV